MLTLRALNRLTGSAFTPASQNRARWEPWACEAAMSHGIILFLSLALFSWAGPPPTPAAPATVSSVSTISGDAEPGTPLVVIGHVFAPDGVTPAPNVIVYAYQT